MATPPAATACSCSDGRLVHDLNIGGQHHVLESDRPVPQGHCRLGIRVQAGPLVPVPPPPAPMQAMVPAWREGTLLIDGEPAGSLRSQAGFNNFISWSGLDIGRDRASPCRRGTQAPFEFTARLKRVTVTLDCAPGPGRRGGRPGRDGAAVAQGNSTRGDSNAGKRPSAASGGAGRRGTCRALGGPGAELSRPPDPLRRALSAGRRHRCHRAHRAGQVAGRAGAEHRHRQQGRGGRLGRHRHRCQGAARWLHRAVHAELAHCQPGHLCQAALRYAEGLRAGGYRGLAAADPGGQSAVPGQQRAPN